MKTSHQIHLPQDLRIIYKEYRVPFLKWIQGKFPMSEDDAEDIFQNAVVIFYDKVTTGKLTELHSSIKTYLFGIGQNLAHDYLRAQKRKVHEPEEILFRHVVDDSDHEDKIQFEEDLRRAMQALDLLGEPCKSILQLYYFEHQSLESICQLLGYKSKESVKVQKCKCLQRLRKLMKAANSEAVSEVVSV